MGAHEGEIRARVLAGIENPERLGASIGGAIPPVAVEFLSRQTFFFIAAEGPGGHPWGTVLSGPAGFLTVLGETRIEIAGIPGEGDPLAAVLKAGTPIGATAVEFETRRRVRVNGTVDLAHQDRFSIITDQVYSNCSQYIQSRRPPEHDHATGGSSAVWDGDRLRSDDVALIANSDTTFLATRNLSGDVDMSHRGGMPGFVEVKTEPGSGSQRLIIPDYRGNRFFNSFGNIEQDPSSTLLFIDFETGSVLHVGGVGEVDWSEPDADEYPGAQRLLRFDVQQVIARTHGIPSGWAFLGYSDKNPGHV